MRRAEADPDVSTPVGRMITEMSLTWEADPDEAEDYGFFIGSDEAGRFG